MARGAKPGERRGGRIKGVPNKTTLARAVEIATEKKAQGKPLAVEAMQDGMYRYIALSAPFQKGGPQENIDQFQHFFDKAMKLADKIANYETPKLQSTTLVGDKDKPISHTLNIRFV